MEKATGGQPFQSTGLTVKPVDTQTFSELGIDHNQAFRWQQLATLEDAEVEQYYAEQEEGEKEITQRALLKKAKKKKKDAEREERVQDEEWVMNLLHGDALELLESFDDEAFDLVVADPPYNVTEHAWDKIGTSEEYLEWLRNWLQCVQPKLAEKYQFFLFCSPEYQADIEMLLRAEGWPIKSRIIWWHRNLPMGRQIEDKFACTWEMVFHCGNHGLDWPEEWNDERFDVQNIPSPQSNYEEEKWHQTAKPVKLIKRFIRFGSNPGDTVLDCFAGGGTTGEACLEVGERHCVLIEKEEEFCDTIKKRLNLPT